MKTVLVTGGAGFVGTHLCQRLFNLGYKVISLDNYFTGSVDNHIQGVEYRSGHTKEVKQYVPEQIDVIFHLGEYSRVEQSLQEPALVWDLNIAGTFGVLEFWRDQNSSTHTCKLIYAGSSTKFGDDGRAREATPYAWTKAVNTELVCNYADWYSLPFVITYFYNVYGPGERTGKYGTVIAIFKDRYLRKLPLQVTSPGTQIRNFTHVSDIVDGLLLVADKGVGDGYGLGNEKGYSVVEVAKMFGAPIEMTPQKPGNRQSSGIDLSKAVALGWRAKKSLEDEIKNFIVEVK